MNILSIFLFSISSNVDNLAVGISYGIKKIRVSILSNILIAVITFAGTLLSMMVGKSFADFIPFGVANFSGSIILITIGLLNIRTYFSSNVEAKNSTTSQLSINSPEKYDHNNNKQIELREAVLLGFALSINNIGLGVGASISGIRVLPSAVGSFIFSIIFLFIGNFIGNGCLNKLIGRYAELLSAIIIIILGLMELIF